MSAQPDDLSRFARDLVGVPPHPGQLDRDALLFAAGRATARRGVFWPATTALFAALSTLLVVVLMVRPPTVVEVERIVYVPAPAPPAAPLSEPGPTQDDLPPPPPAPPSPTLVQGLRLRQRVLQEGVGALPEPPWASASTPSENLPDLTSLRLNSAHANGGRLR